MNMFTCKRCNAFVTNTLAALKQHQQDPEINWRCSKRLNFEIGDAIVWYRNDSVIYRPYFPDTDDSLYSLISRQNLRRWWDRVVEHVIQKDMNEPFVDNLHAIHRERAFCNAYAQLAEHHRFEISNTLRPVPHTFIIPPPNVEYEGEALIYKLEQTLTTNHMLFKYPQ